MLVLKLIVCVLIIAIVGLIFFVIPINFRKKYVIIVGVLFILALIIPIAIKVIPVMILRQEVSKEEAFLQEKEVKFENFKAELLEQDTYIEINDLSLGKTSAFIADAVLYNDEKIYKITPKNELYVYVVEERTFSAWGYWHEFLNFELMKENLEDELNTLRSKNSRYVLADKYQIPNELAQEIREVIVESLSEYKKGDISEYEATPEDFGFLKQELSPIITIDGKEYSLGGACLLNIPDKDIYCVVSPNIFKLIDPLIEDYLKK